MIQSLQRLEKYVFQVLIFLLPTQLAYHFWPSFSKVSGIRVDYLAPSVYLTDLLLTVFIAVFILRLYLSRDYLVNRVQTKKLLTIITLLTALLVINGAFSDNSMLSAVKSLSIIQLTFFALIIAFNNKLKLKEWIIVPLCLSLIFFVSIGTLQVLLSRSVGGAMYIFGERLFSIQTPGIALARIGSSEFLRAYSTFSHPNSLAGYLLVSLILLIGYRKILRDRSYLVGLATIASLVGLLLAFSKAVFLVLVLLSVLAVVKGGLSKKAFGVLTYILVIIVIAASLISPAYLHYLDGLNGIETISRRIDLVQVSASIISDKMFLGVGLNNFIPNLPGYLSGQEIWWLQPVHNVYLLIFSEVGMLGLAAFSLLLIASVSRALSDSRYYLVFAILAIMLTGVVDHYWLTLRQNMLMFSVVAGLIYRREIRI